MLIFDPRSKRLSENVLGNKCILNFHLGRYIVGFTVGNLVIQSKTISNCISDDIPPLPKWNFEFGYPRSNALLQFLLKLKRCKLHKAKRHPIICDLINDIKIFSDSISQDILWQIFDVIQSDAHYKSKCIRISYVPYAIILPNRNTCHHKIIKK